MSASGLLAILDDIGSMLDGGSGLEEIGVEKATKLAHGGLIDDIERAHDEKIKIDHRHEMAVVLEVAKGALRNKLLYFIPTTFAIAAFAPWAVMPLCIGSGAYIAYEGVKRLEARKNRKEHALHQEELMRARLGGKETLLRYEKEKISQAIKTDAALSLELTGFQVGMAAGAPLAAKLAVISAISIGATVALYATVIGIIGLNHLAHKLSQTQGDGRSARAKRAVGRVLARFSSPLMKTIAFIGMGALFFVGGHLLSAFVPGVPGVLAAVGGIAAGVPLLAMSVGTAAVIATGIVGGVVSYAGVRGAAAAHKFLARREDTLYSRALETANNAVPRGSLRKAFAQASVLAKKMGVKGAPVAAPDSSLVLITPDKLAAAFSPAAEKTVTNDNASGNPASNAKPAPLRAKRPRPRRSAHKKSP
ncbi:MAG: DUF808 family protein [Alphaproteobacteria bacterium]|nr:DUF808 family protein [Alphaproteobacteria bacterium]